VENCPFYPAENVKTCDTLRPKTALFLAGPNCLFTKVSGGFVITKVSCREHGPPKEAIFSSDNLLCSGDNPVIPPLGLFSHICQTESFRIKNHLPPGTKVKKARNQHGKAWNNKWPAQTSNRQTSLWECSRIQGVS